jgi:hypothetical protein
MIVEARRVEREKMPNDLRQAVALEHIADTLEELRIQMAGVAQVLGTIATHSSKRP